MRAATGGAALLLPCPQCATKWSTEQTLAGHLMDGHGMEPQAAVTRALETSTQSRRGHAIQVGQQQHRGQEEAPSMGKAVKACGYCKSTEHKYTDCAKAKAYWARKKRTPLTRKSPKTPASPNGLAGALAALRAEREELDAAITALERLEGRRR